MKTKTSLMAGALGVAMSIAADAQPAFSSLDVGRQNPAGQTVVTNGGFDVSSATGDVWDISDNFRFVYQQVSGDFDIRTRIASLVGVAYWTKAGLMVREDLTEFGANGFMIATRSSGLGRYFFTARLAAFYATYSYFAASFERVRYPDVWVRLVRVGERVIPMHSTNGVAWTQTGDLEIAQLPAAAYVGLAVSNHPDSGSTKATAQFRDVTLDRGSPVAPVIPSQPISVIANPDAEVTFNVVALGQGTLEYQWFLNGAAIDGATNASHTVVATPENDGSKFTCLVRNEAGKVLSWAGLLEVQPAGQPFDGILLERYTRIPGRLVEYMVNATNYPAAPASTGRPSLFEVSGLSDETGARLRGYLTTPLVGDYTFYIAADDRGDLWLGSDDNPVNKELVALSYYWVAPRDWDFYESQVSLPIRLEAGRRYYVEALIRGEGSPNQGAVGWRLPDGKFERPIPANRFIGEPARLAAVRSQPSGRFEADVEGTQNSLYVIETSPDLNTWSAVVTNRVPFVFVDLEPAVQAQRFFRAAARQ
ncbi:MAG: hypothetical protein IPM17_17735 [Verrucomicrobia bacterium]|nr:hypothetical protein [Verrucomicrobiota bacterium]